MFTKRGHLLYCIHRCKDRSKEPRRTHTAVVTHSRHSCTMRKEVLVAAGAVAATAVTAAAAAVARKQGDLSGVWKPTRTDEWSRSPLRNCSLSRIHLTIHLGATLGYCYRYSTSFCNQRPLMIAPRSFLSGKVVPSRMRTEPLLTFLSSSVTRTAMLHGPVWCPSISTSTVSAAVGR